MPSFTDNSSAWKPIVEAHPHLRRYVFPRLNRYIPSVPTAKQSAFLLCNHLEGFFGGAARGGKSEALLMAALQYVDCPGYNALLIRRTFGQLNMPDSILNRAHQWLRKTDARWNAMANRYEFPSGANLQFGYLQYFKDVYQYDGASFQFIGFDELTQFLEGQYRFLFSRLSKAAGSKLPIRMRSASNPGGLGHSWVKARFITSPPGKNRFFIPSLLTDNPHIDQAGYIESLQELDIVTRKQRQYGDWDAVRDGAFFKREWFASFLDRSPEFLYRYRFWDLAATVAKPGKDPDYVVGALLGMKDRDVYIEDIRRGRYSPQQVENLIISTAHADGRMVRVRIEQEPGASGKLVIDQFRRLLPGYDVQGVPASGSKMTRWNSFASAAEKGRVHLLNSPWNDALMDELMGVPDHPHDDQADAVSGAYNSYLKEFSARPGITLMGGKNGPKAETSRF